MYYNEAAGVCNVLFRLVQTRQLCSRPDWRWQQVVSLAIRSTLNFGVNLPWGSSGGSIGGFYRGGPDTCKKKPVSSTRRSMEGSTGGFDRGGSTERARCTSTCTTMKPPVTATYPRDSHGLQPGNHGQRPFGQVLRPDRVVFGRAGVGNKLAKGYHVLHLDEIVIPRTDHPPLPRHDQAVLGISQPWWRAAAKSSSGFH